MSVESAIKNYYSKIKDIENLDKDSKENIYEETSQLIEYYEGMTGKVEDKRNSIYSSAVNRLSMIIAFLTLVFTVNFNAVELLPYFIPVYVFFAISVINELLIIIVYWMQSSCKYVTKDVRLKDYGNYWKRFYYGNDNILDISTSLKSNLKTSGKSQNNAFDEKSVEAYVKGLNFMVDKYSKETLDQKVENNIKQLYLMQVHNYYKNRYNLSLASINNGFVVVKIVGVVIAIVVELIVFL